MKSEKGKNDSKTSGEEKKKDSVVEWPPRPKNPKALGTSGTAATVEEAGGGTRSWPGSEYVWVQGSVLSGKKMFRL